jgi:hypothetical protein
MIRPRSLAGVLTLLVLTAVLSACAGSDDSAGGVDSPPIRPVEEILDGEIEVADLTSTSAVVRVTTSVPVACSVVFGTTEEFGQQATDLDMGGGAHSDHAAPLRGLEPDTEYVYRLQGTGSDGTFYVSELRTFRTPPAAEGDAERGSNLAGAEAGAQVTEVSSIFGGSDTWAGANAIDGDPTTEWSSAGDGDDAYLEVELAEPATIASVGIWTRTMGSTAQITSFQVVATGGDVLGPFEVPDASGVHVFDLDQPVEAQTLRFEVVTSSGGNTGLVEFVAYGE